MSTRGHGAPDARSLAALPGFCLRLAGDSDLGPVLRDLLEHARSLTGAERGFFLFRREGALRCEAAAGEAAGPAAGAAGEGPAEPPRPSLPEGVLARVLQSGEAIISTDLPADGRFRARASVRRLGLRSVLAVPFPARTGGIGVLYLDSRVSRTVFRSEDLELLTAIAAQAALALDIAALAPPPAPAAAAPPGSAPAPVRSRTGIVGASAAMRHVLELVRRVGPTELPVLIVGESGTGKELIAREIHAGSSRTGGPFVAENCAAIPESLIEAELFGAVRGAYTGSDRDREGLFRSADGGTLFLDEIGEMPLPLQARLLRALQEAEVRPVGSHRTHRVNVRVVAATNRDPAAAIASRRLRLDLYYRLAGMTIELPPLRDRPEDIAPLAEHFLARRAPAAGVPPPRLSPGALAVLSRYDWPGNVRELENELERASVLARGETIEASDLSLRLAGSPAAPARAGLPAERTMIERTLLAADGNVTEAAGTIGWSRQKLYRRMSSLGVPRTYGRRPA